MLKPLVKNGIDQPSQQVFRMRNLKRSWVSCGFATKQGWWWCGHSPGRAWSKGWGRWMWEGVALGPPSPKSASSQLPGIKAASFSTLHDLWNGIWGHNLVEAFLVMMNIMWMASWGELGRGSPCHSTLSFCSLTLVLQL